MDVSPVRLICCRRNGTFLYIMKLFSIGFHALVHLYRTFCSEVTAVCSAACLGSICSRLRRWNSNRAVFFSPFGPATCFIKSAYTALGLGSRNTHPWRLPLHWLALKCARLGPRHVFVQSEESLKLLAVRYVLRRLGVDSLICSQFAKYEMQCTATRGTVWQQLVKLHTFHIAGEWLLSLVLKPTAKHWKCPLAGSYTWWCFLF